MAPSELELCTTSELIDELVRRNTFLGVVVHAEDDCRAKRWPGEKVFRVRFNENLKPDEAGRLLEVVVGHMERELD